MKKTMKVWSVLLILTVVFVAAGCSDKAAGPEAGTASSQGTRDNPYQFGDLITIEFNGYRESGTMEIQFEEVLDGKALKKMYPDRKFEDHAMRLKANVALIESDSDESCRLDSAINHGRAVTENLMDLANYGWNADAVGGDTASLYAGGSMNVYINIDLESLQDGDTVKYYTINYNSGEEQEPKTVWIELPKQYGMGNDDAEITSDSVSGEKEEADEDPESLETSAQPGDTATSETAPLVLNGYRLEKNSIGSPQLYLDASNVSEEIIKEFTVTVFAYDADGVPVKVYFNKFTKNFAYTNAVKPGESTKSNSYFQLYGEYDEQKQFVVLLKSVEYFDETKWENPDYSDLYAKYNEKLLEEGDPMIL